MFPVIDYSASWEIYAAVTFRHAKIMSAVEICCEFCIHSLWAKYKE
jgi:hypothetical protein